MPDKLRSLYLHVLNDAEPIHQITGPLHYLDCMFPREKLEEALKILVRKGITGRNFIEWFHTKCGASGLEMHRQLIKEVERARYARKLFASQDLRQ